MTTGIRLCSLALPFFLAATESVMAITPPVYQSGIFDGDVAPDSGNYSDNTMGLFQASQFTLDQSFSITGITLQGYFESPPPSNLIFTVAILSGDPSDPAVIGSAVVSPEVSVLMVPLGDNGQNYFFLTPETPFTLSAGTYWLSVAGTGDPGDMGPPPNALRWAANGSIYSDPPLTTGTPDATSFNGQDGTYFLDTSDPDGPALVQYIYSFQGEPVPEPAAFSFAGLGLLAAVLRRRR